MPIGQLLIGMGLAWFGYLLVTVIKKPNEWPSLAQIIPLLSFLHYARCFDLSEACWPYAFVLAGFIALVVTLILSPFNVVMDRQLLGINLFFILGGFAFAANLDGILNVLDHYRGPFFLGCIALVGLVTTLCTKAGFIGKQSNHKHAVTNASWILFGACVLAVTWSYLLNSYGLIWSTVLPFIAIRLVREKLVNMLHKGLV